MFGGGGAVEAVTGGGYAPDKDEFYTYNMTTDAYTAITVFPTTVYNSGGFGNSTGFLCFGGYTPSTTTSSYEWDGLAWSAGGTTPTPAGSQNNGAGSLGDAMLCGSGMSSYGSQSTYSYASSVWATGGANLTYWQRGSVQSGNKTGSAMSISGYGGNTGGAAGATARQEGCTRGAWNGAWGAIALTSHRVFGNSFACGGDPSDFTYACGYTNLYAIVASDLNTNYNGSSYTSLTICPTNRYSPQGLNGNDSTKVYVLAGVIVNGGHITSNTCNLWNNVAWSTLNNYPVTSYAGCGGAYDV